MEHVAAGELSPSSAVVQPPSAASRLRMAALHDEWIAGERRYLSEGSMAKLYKTGNTDPVAAIESSDT